MKIICKDNYDRETISDSLVCENISKIMGELIVRLLNEREGSDSPNYFMLVEDNQKLYKYEP